MDSLAGPTNLWCACLVPGTARLESWIALGRPFAWERWTGISRRQIEFRVSRDELLAFEIESSARNVIRANPLVCPRAISHRKFRFVKPDG